MQMSLTTNTPTQRHPKMFGRRLGAAAVKPVEIGVDDDVRPIVALTRSA
jgi:hypothetical protein